MELDLRGVPAVGRRPAVTAQRALSQASRFCDERIGSDLLPFRVMATSTPIRVDEDIHALATAVAPTMSRSAAQQVSHWARIGKEFELSPSVSARAVEQVLAGRAAYDDLDEREQALVRAAWAERTEQRRRDLDLAAEFAAEGRSFVELDDEGSIVTRQP